jgi:CcmD family protein
MTQANPTTPTVEERSQEFKPVSGAAENTTSAEVVLVAAYVVMWAILMGFLFTTFRRQAAVDKRLGDLERDLERALPKRPPDA